MYEVLLLFYLKRRVTVIGNVVTGQLKYRAALREQKQQLAAPFDVSELTKRYVRRYSVCCYCYCSFCFLFQLLLLRFVCYFLDIFIYTFDPFRFLFFQPSFKF